MSSKFRFALHVYTTIVLSLKLATDGYTAADVNNWQTWDWFQLSVTVLALIGNNGLAFYDRSAQEEAEQKLKAGKTQ